jgi:hypothetical protein
MKFVRSSGLNNLRVNTLIEDIKLYRVIHKSVKHFKNLQ